MVRHPYINRTLKGILISESCPHDTFLIIFPIPGEVESLSKWRGVGKPFAGLKGVQPALHRASLSHPQHASLRHNKGLVFRASPIKKSTVLLPCLLQYQRWLVLVIVLFSCGNWLLKLSVQPERHLPTRTAVMPGTASGQRPSRVCVAYQVQSCDLDGWPSGMWFQAYHHIL